MGESFLAFSLDEIVNDVAIHEYFFSRYNEAPIAKEDNHNYHRMGSYAYRVTPFG